MVMKLRSSATHPLRIAEVRPRGDRGTIGITLCPGKKQPHGMSGSWARNLETDVKAIRDWGATMVLTLVTDEELDELGVTDLGAAVARAGMSWLHLPIADGCAPDEQFEAAWLSAFPQLSDALSRGEKVLVHCKGGLGRAGTVAAMLLVDTGDGPGMAMCKVREERPGAVETDAQEEFVIYWAVTRAARGGLMRQMAP